MMRKFYPGITLFKLAGAILVLASHALFIPSITAMELPDAASFLMLESRIVVPCFYVVSGFLLYNGWSHAAKPAAYVRRYLIRIALVYAALCLLFVFEHIVPALLQGGFGLSNLFLQAKILAMAVFVNGPLIQLWFIPPLLFGAAASYWMLNRLKPGMIIAVLAAAYLAIQFISGSLLSVSEAWVEGSTLLSYGVTAATRYIGFGLTFVTIGALLAKYEEKLQHLNVRTFAAAAITLAAAETALLIAFAPWTDAYKLTVAIVPNTMLLFYGVLRIRSSAITAHHKLFNLFSIVTFLAHIPFMRLNGWLFGWSMSMEAATWQLTLQTMLTFVECAALTLILHRRSAAARAQTEREARSSGTSAETRPSRSSLLRPEQLSSSAAAKTKSELTT